MEGFLGKKPRSKQRSLWFFFLILGKCGGTRSRMGVNKRGAAKEKLMATRRNKRSAEKAAEPN